MLIYAGACACVVGDVRCQYALWKFEARARADISVNQSNPRCGGSLSRVHAAPPGDLSCHCGECGTATSILLLVCASRLPPTITTIYNRVARYYILVYYQSQRLKQQFIDKCKHNQISAVGIVLFGNSVTISIQRAWKLTSELNFRAVKTRTFRGIS